MSTAAFVRQVKGFRGTDVFNPYADRCDAYDEQGAASRRCRVLAQLVSAAAESEVDSLWIGRDLGYRGGRRTGLALTDEVNMHRHGERWGVEVRRCTKGPPVAERTAGVIWGVMEGVQEAVFLWNVFPWHPHRPAEPLSNRAHNALERRIGEDVLVELVDLLRPRRLVPIGKDAASVAMRVGGTRQIVRMRHPSYGGQTVFRKQARNIYGQARGGWLDD